VNFLIISIARIHRARNSSSRNKCSLSLVIHSHFSRPAPAGPAGNYRKSATGNHSPRWGGIAIPLDSSLDGNSRVSVSRMAKSLMRFSRKISQRSLRGELSHTHAHAHACTRIHQPATNEFIIAGLIRPGESSMRPMCATNNYITV